ncbi:hypothetical protein DPX16_16300 [Anabarilius grahami]|uniref:CCHC-type domain-containing protein n=1 Tax=Anabarilius grahami TaxID=495550 RepID=A0A3N0XK37_ANAGA|nr:hypothetical protein DPX16_16300 [Anabarilius grahami]
MSTAPRWDTRESSQPTVRERRMPYSDSPLPLENPERSRNITSGPFAAELEVIQQRARTSGPTRATPSIETSVRHRSSERCSQLLPPTYAVEQRHSILPHQGQAIPQESPRAKLAIFDGSGDWESFLVPFERQARNYGWSGAHRVDYLHECLRGAAIKYVCSLPEHIREDYILLKEQLTQRFGQRDPPTTIRRKLGEIRQFKESAAEFAEEVQCLVTLANPGVELDLQDQLATDFFLKGLHNQKVAYEVMNRDPHLLVEAQRLVEAHEHNYRATMGREVDAKSRARCISWADDDEVSSETSAASRRVQSPTYITANQLALLSQKTAFLTETVERISKNYVTADQFHLLMEKMEQLQSKLDNAVAKEPRKLEEANQEKRRGRSPIQSGAAQTKSYSPSPSRVGTGLCYHCGEEGHFRRECVRLSTPPPNSSPSSKEQNRSTAPRDLVSWRSQSPTPQVGRTTSRGPSLLIDATMNSIPVRAVVDTGAEATVISETLYQQFPLNKQTALTQTCLHNAESEKDMSAKAGLKVKFQIGTWSAEWEVYVALIRDSVLLGLDLLQAANVTIHSSGRVFIEEELVPAKIVRVDNPKPGVCAVLEPYLITESVASRRVVTTMEQRVIDLWSGIAEQRTDSLAVPDFLYNLEKGLKESHDSAREHLRTAQERQKKTYDHRSQERTYNMGDLVYMRDSTKKKGQSPKLQAPWKGPFVISACCGPVLYEVQGLRHKRIRSCKRAKIPLVIL